MKFLDRINRMDRIFACPPEAGQAKNHRLRREKQYGDETRKVIICTYQTPRSGYVFQAALPERAEKLSC
jgi:hypothetical protein